MNRLILVSILLVLASGPPAAILGPMQAQAQEPTAEPIIQPAQDTTAEPTTQPAQAPTAEPTNQPADAPTTEPPAAPTVEPTTPPTEQPIADPTSEPTTEATSEPIPEPTQEPTSEPTAEPIPQPTQEPTAEPTSEPIILPAAEPTAEPITSEPAADVAPQAVFVTAAGPATGPWSPNDDGSCNIGSAVTITAHDRATGADLSTPDVGFRFIVNEDVANDPAFSGNPRSYSPLMAVGDDANATVCLPSGKYLVSVMGGPFPPTPGGYKMSGKHFTVPASNTVDVELVPGPLPLSSINVVIHHDNLMVNGAQDIPVEQGLRDFAILLEDGTGEVSVDFFGNPICTEYDGNGNPISGTGGQCLTDENGEVTVPNLGAGKYGVFVVPPDGQGWVQTSTLEGTHTIDAWVEEGNKGFITEAGVLGPAVAIGFVQECEFGLCPQLNNQGNLVFPNTPNPAQGSAQIIGRVREASEAGGEFQVVEGKAVPEPYIALNNLSGNDEQVYTGRGNPDGTFTIPNVPPGTYQLVYWDEPQLYIISFATVQVNPDDTVVDMGDLLTPRWFGQIQGYTYIDNGVTKDGRVISGGAENGIRDCIADGNGLIDPHNVDSCEQGLPNQDLDIRFNDGSIKYASFSDSNGYYDFPEHFPYGHYLIWEVGFGRMKQVSTAGYFTEFSGDGLTPIPTGYPYNPQNRPGCGDDPNCTADTGPASLLQAEITLAGFYNWIDTGKVPYGPGENGGISGIVHYAATRNEFDPRLAAAEDYEPGVPNVTINLYQAALDATQQPISCTAVGDGCPYGAGELMRVGTGAGDVIDSVETDSYDANHPTDCVYPDLLGGTINDPDCREVPINLRQIQDGVFDGGYAFEGTPKGAYIVEMVAPPGYRHIKEEDQNTDQGDDFIPQVPPPPCAGPLHLVNDPRNPADGHNTPLCDSKFVRVIDGTNPPAEFYVMTAFDDSDATDFTGTAEVPPPGFIRGTLFDDLNVQFDPNSVMFQGKKGVPNTPIGVLDFQGNEITVVNTDDEGFFEVLLPSGYTRLCPTPGGVCPAIYLIVGNYPGQDPLNPLPNWNPAYATLTLPLDVWTGKTTYADVAILPITGFGFDNPPVCTVTGPDVQSVDTVAGPRGTTSFNIYGSGFGSSPGSVALGITNQNINSWSDTVINVTIPNSQPRGSQQLLVTNSAGDTSQTGITFHVTGSGGGGPAYNPPIRNVGPSQTYSTIQAAIDAANNGDLIIVHPGEYFESPILYKNVKLQGFGPGATSIDGRFLGFGAGAVFDTAAWEAKMAAINPVGPQAGGLVPIGQVVTVVATSSNTHNNNNFPTQIDGFTIIGGDSARAGNSAAPSQGGGIYAHARARRLVVSNNSIQSNAGNAGGGVILGQAYVGNNFNQDVRIHHNRVLNNGGTILAGGIAIFNNADRYEIDHNLICGNQSAEYGGGISHFGRSDGGQIHDNQIVFNSAFDEGGGIMVAGELPLVLGGLSAGSGDVTIERNLIQHNLSNDDGGGIRLLMPVDGQVRIINNMVVNNLATDIGGGIALDDALDVEIINNTVARNISTATAEDADRLTCNPPALGSCPHVAGIASQPHSAALLDRSPAPATDFTDPLQFNNVIWDNQAWYLNDGTDPQNPLDQDGIIDLEVFGSSNLMNPNFSLLTADYDGCTSGGGNNCIIGDPPLVAPITLNFHALPLAGEPAFIGVAISATPAGPQGDYHLSASLDGTASFGGVNAPMVDFEMDTRSNPPDMSADEYIP
ncbi:MAG: pectin esterase [Anaerolineales bacterium]|nr:pectin esterase [Anaerolineales bacterium]